MGIADGMKSITEDIIASYDLRVKAADDRAKAVGDILGDARDTIEGFSEERRKMSDAQAKDLAKFVDDLSKNVGELLKDARNMLKDFQKNHKLMSEEQAKKLAEFVNNLTSDVGKLRKNAQNSVKQMSKDRSKMSAELKEKLSKEANDLALYVTKKLKEFDDEHSQMSVELKKSLAKFVQDILSTVKGILGDANKFIGGCHSDMQKAKTAWKSMSAILAKGRKKGLPVQIDAGEQKETVENAVEKKDKINSKKKKKK